MIKMSETKVSGDYLIGQLASIARSRKPKDIPAGWLVRNRGGKTWHEITGIERGHNYVFHLAGSEPLRWGARAELRILPSQYADVIRKLTATGVIEIAEGSLEAAMAAYKAINQRHGPRNSMIAALEAAGLWLDGKYLEEALSFYRNGYLGADTAMRNALCAVTALHDADMSDLYARPCPHTGSDGQPITCSQAEEQAKEDLPGVSLDEQRRALHDLIIEAETLARYIRLVSKGTLSLAVVDNHGTTLRERQGLNWSDAHLAADKALTE